MERRHFFRALIGAGPLIAAAAPAKPRPVMARGRIPVCECGFEFEVRRAYTDQDNFETGGGLLKSNAWPAGIASDREHPFNEYMVCHNLKCAHHDKPFAVPRVELAPADPRMVAFVKEQLAREAEEYRRRKEEQAARDAAWRVEWARHGKAKVSNLHRNWGAGVSFPIEALQDDAYHLAMHKVFTPMKYVL